MASKSIAGLYSAQAQFDVTESAANTLTFEKLDTGMSVYDKVGWVINRVEFRLAASSYALFNGSGDYLIMALTATNSLTALNPNNPAIYIYRQILRQDLGTAATGLFVDTSFDIDYSNLPGGGILVLPSPFYMGIVGSGLSGAATCITRIYFQAIDMSDQDYFNLVQARQLLISS